LLLGLQRLLAILGDPRRGTVLDVYVENGQAAEVFRSAVIATLALTLALGGCKKKGGAEAVADLFAEAYFEHADQEKAKEYTALGATTMLDEELRAVEKIRKEGYTPSDGALGDIRVHRGPSSTRDQRIRFPYEVVVRSEGVETVRDADVELTEIQGAWKVVRVGVKQRAQ
jgi:hypothetical protein